MPPFLTGAFDIIPKISTWIQVAALALVILYFILKSAVSNSKSESFNKSVVNKLFLFIGFVFLTIVIVSVYSDSQSNTKTDVLDAKISGNIRINNERVPGVKVTLSQAHLYKFTDDVGNFTIEYPSIYTGNLITLHIEYQKKDTAIDLTGLDTNSLININWITYNKDDRKLSDTKKQPGADPETNTGSNNPDGEIKSVKIQHNIHQSGVFGLKILVSFDVSYMNKLPGLLSVDFFDLNNQPIKDTDGSMNYNDGSVGKDEKFYATFIHSTYEDFEIFIPYNELESINGKHSSRFKITLYWDNKRSNEWQGIISSDYYDLSYEDK